MATAVSEAQERYLEAVYILERTGGARAARVGERLGVRAPSVSLALRRLEAQGLLQPLSGHALHLSPAGVALAEQVMRRHRVLERWLVGQLGLDWSRAHGEAQRMEHAVSAEVVDRLYEVMGRPETCPHGNPIPGPGGLPAYAGDGTLDRVAQGSSVRVARIAEDAEEDAGQLAALERLGLRPGARLCVLEAGDEVRFDSGAGPLSLPAALASKVWIDRAEADPSGATGG